MRNDTKDTIQAVEKSSHTLLSGLKRIDTSMNHSNSRAIGEDVAENDLDDGLNEHVENQDAVSDSTTSDVVEIYLAQAQLYWDDQQWESAINACNNALQISPQSATVYKLLGNFYQQRGKSADAMGCYAKALSLQPGSPEIYSNLGSLYAKQEHWQKSIAYYQKALSKDSRFAPAYLNLARVWKKLGNEVEERKCMRMALKLNATMGSAQEHYQIAQDFEIEDKGEEAITFYRQAVERDCPKTGISLFAHQRLASLLEEKGDWQAATKSYHQVIELTTASHIPKPSPHKLSLAQSSKKASKIGNSRDYSATLATTNSATVVPPVAPKLSGLSKEDQQRIHRLLTSSSYKKLLLKPAANAKALLRPSSQSSPQSSMLLAQQAVQRKDWSTAIEYFRQAIKHLPRSAVLYRNLAKALSYNSQSKASAEAWFRSFVLEPNWPSAEQYLELAKKLESQGNTKAATHCYQYALKLEPQANEASVRLQQLTKQKLLRPQNHKSQQALQPKQVQALANAMHQKGEALRDQGDWEKACQTYRKAAQLNPSFSWSYHSMGDCYKKMGDWTAAADAYRRAISLNGEFFWSYYSLAEVLEKQEKWESAAECYRRARVVDPDNEQAPPRLAGALQHLLKKKPRDIGLYTSLADQLLAQDKTEEAISQYQLALQIQPHNAELALSLSKLLAERNPQESHALLDRAIAMSAQGQIQSTNSLQELDIAAFTLQHSHLFDPIYYWNAHPQVADEVKSKESKSLLLHYIEKGSTRGYNPNPLFDDAFYRTQHPELEQQQRNPLVHYCKEGYKSDLDPHPFFDAKFYKKKHKDIARAEINPLDHFLAYGAKEGRVAFSSEQFSKMIEARDDVNSSYIQPLWTPKNERLSRSSQKIGLYCNTRGNYFITEIADFIATALSQAGHEVVRLSEQDKPLSTLSAHWIIAPHEFFYLGDGVKWEQDQEWLSDCVMVNVEQPQTTWFSKAFHFLRHCKVIFDINVKSAGLMHALGLPAYWLPLGYIKDYSAFTINQALPTLRALSGLPSSIKQKLPEISQPLSCRPIDIHFIGTLNKRREDFFAGNANWLSKHRSFLHIPPMGVPLIKGQDQSLDTAAVIGISRRSKIMLNVHRDECSYFEWHRIVFHGLWQNTLVVTEPCHDIPGLVAGEHFIACQLEDMAEKVDWLLYDPEGKKMAENVRNNGHETFKLTFNGIQSLAAAAQITEREFDYSSLSKVRGLG